MRTALLPALGLLASLGGSACITTAAEGEAMRNDIAALKKDVDEEKRANAAERERLAAAQKELFAKLTDAMDNLNKAARKTGADLAVDLGKAQGDMDKLRGAVDESNHKLDAFSAGMARPRARENCLPNFCKDSATTRSLPTPSTGWARATTSRGDTTTPSSSSRRCSRTGRAPARYPTRY
jgi:hypothetical protein